MLALGGCYKPNIAEGGFRCTEAGECPDGLTCATDMHCYMHPPAPLADTGMPPPPPPQEAGMDTMMTSSTDADASGGEPTCQPPPPLCADGPAAGDVCSPACQRGCACGRCNVVDGRPACVPAGTIAEGGVCNAAADNCAPGLFCSRESCGNGLARCYRHCTSNAQCGDTSCTLSIYDNQRQRTSFKTCDVPAQTCDPLGGPASGCPVPLVCYIGNANQTLCDCPRATPAPGANGAECTIYSDCADGFICITINGESSAHCRFVCEVGAATSSCPQSAPHCMASGTGTRYGFCAQ
jgi:hypothetical protein